MKYKIHYPTEQYGFIEAEADTRDEAVAEYFDIKATFDDKEGLNTLEWAKFRREFLMSEGKDQNIETHDKLNKSQRWWVHQTQLTLKDINKE